MMVVVLARSRRWRRDGRLCWNEKKM